MGQLELRYIGQTYWSKQKEKNRLKTNDTCFGVKEKDCIQIRQFDKSFLPETLTKIKIAGNSSNCKNLTKLDYDILKQLTNQ